MPELDIEVGLDHQLTWQALSYCALFPYMHVFKAPITICNQGSFVVRGVVKRSAEINNGKGARNVAHSMMVGDIVKLKLKM